MEKSCKKSFDPRDATFLILTIILLTASFAASADIPRPEHPQPQFQREKWINLNGPWDFKIDTGLSGVERHWYEKFDEFDQKIMVPFCPESKLSGIEHKDFMPAVWYHRSFTLPESWSGSRIFLHFGGVDYDCQAWVNGKKVGRHYGGSTSFSFEITQQVKPGENNLAVYAVDDIRSGQQPSGKQSPTYFNQGCCKYTRVTGIWQTVWAEARPQQFIESVRIVPDLDHSRFIFTPIIKNSRKGLTFNAILSLPNGKKVAAVQTAAQTGMTCFLKIKNPRIWSPADPFLYDLVFELTRDTKTIDRVSSYAGLRKIEVEGNKIFLNNKPIFLRFVLDQGFYPGGVWTAPSDAELKGDIKRSLAVGFNGARLHQKIFEERFHYWADKLGYLTWGEMTDWGTNFSDPQTLLNLKREWRQAVLRDLNHPSIIAWTPLNETAGHARRNPEIHRRFVSDLVDLTHALDPTRPVNDASGYVHIKTDLFTIHDYTQNPKTFAERYTSLNSPDFSGVFIGKPHQAPELSEKYSGQPYIVDEYGGTFWTKMYAGQPAQGNSRSRWGYGKSGNQVLDLIEALTAVLTDNPKISGFTYTQLTDVEQEVNGIYSFDRQLKFDRDRLKKIFGRPAAIEKK